MNLLHFIIFIVVSYYCAYVLDFGFTNFCKLLRKNPFGSINKVIISIIKGRRDEQKGRLLELLSFHPSERIILALNVLVMLFNSWIPSKIAAKSLNKGDKGLQRLQKP